MVITRIAASRAIVVVLVAIVAATRTASPAAAASAVFAGDPLDPVTGVPYEILPGQPLVLPGPDGRLGTADDIVDQSTIGDIDLVVRLGTVPADGSIPDPAPRRGTVAVGTAGSRGGGTPISFTVYLSDGAVGPGQPYGHLLAAADMEGLPVVVILFADLDGDGVIGPSGTDPARQVRALAELDPVGREVAFFSGGVASGTIAVTAGGPPSSGGLTIVATALAFTGSYDPAVLGGFVPTGPGITTAQPFLPERDPSRLFTGDLAALAAGGTLNPRPRAAALPIPGAGLDLALRTDGSSPTIDVARAVAGAPVCARLVEIAGHNHGVSPAPSALTLGTRSSAAKTKLRLVAVDRLGNPTDAGTPLPATVTVDGPFFLKPDLDHVQQSERTTIDAKKRTIAVHSTGAGAGVLRVAVRGAQCQQIAAEARPERNRRAADAVVALSGVRDFSSITAAVTGAVDRNADGRITIEVADGVYHESVRLARAVELRGRGPARTVIDAHGAGPALAIADPGAVATGLTLTGGTVGISLEAPVTVRGLEARANVGAGVQLAAGAAVATACTAQDNGGDGFVIAAPATVDASLGLANAGAGVSATGAGVTITANRLAANGGAGVTVVGGTDPTLTENEVAGNFAGGMTLDDTAGGTLVGNRLAGNDGDGLALSHASGALVDGNDCTANRGYGIRLDRSSADFDAAPGTQDAPGSNDTSGNRKGSLLIR